MKKRNLVVLIVGLILLGVAGIAQAAPIQWATNGHYYEVRAYPSGIAWDEAKTVAENSTYLGMKGHLATVTSMEENSFIVNNLGGASALDGYFLGGYQPEGSPEPAGNWQWVTGETWSFTNWYPGSNEPNNTYNGSAISPPSPYTTQEDVLHLSANNGMWNDVPLASGWGGLIIEYEPSAPVLPTISGTPPATATVGTLYTFTPLSTDVTSFSSTDNLPPGLTLNTTTGVLSGIPTITGTYSNIVISATNGNGTAALSAFSISVAADTISPNITFTTVPLNYSNQAYGTIAFTANEAVTFECKLDSSSFAPCTSPFNYSNLANGQHTLTVRATDSQENTSTSTFPWNINTVLPASSAILLPQTGQSKCYDYLTEISCDGTGDDGDIRAGVPWPIRRFTDNNNGTITDNLTDVVWMKNTNCFGGQTWADALIIAKDLESGRCGLTDGSTAGQWRLPAINELESIIDLQNDDPSLPRGHPFTNDESDCHWTSTTLARYPQTAWSVDEEGGIHSGNKDDLKSVWCVRSSPSAGIAGSLPWSGQATCYDDSNEESSCAGTGQDGDVRPGVTWPSPRFRDNGDGTQADRLTGLIWSKDSNPRGVDVSWQEALDYIKSLNSRNWLGYSDWRLPNRKELMSLINREEQNNAKWLMDQGFSDTQMGMYWSSSTYVDDENNAWVINMRYGGVYEYNKEFNDYVWPVRGGYIQQKLSVVKTGTGIGAVTLSTGSLSWNGSNGTTRINPGETVTLTASAGSGSTFTGWSGDCNGTGDCTITLDKAKSVTAVFAVAKQLEIRLEGAGTGSVHSDPAGLACDSGTCITSFPVAADVTLLKTPGIGSLFEHWDGACTGSGRCSVTMDVNRSVTAIFSSPPPAKVNTTFHSSLQAAYDAASPDDVIMLKEGTPTGALDADKDKTVTIRGGYRADYSVNDGETALLGTVILKSGNVLFDKVGIR